jgi:hypothetical protein
MVALSHDAMRAVVFGVALAVGATWPSFAGAQAPPASTDMEESILPAQSTIPPAVGNPFIQYGVAFTTEFVASSGPLCSQSQAQPCVLGSGGGVVFPRIGWRSSGPWYFGSAYEMSKQDANTIYELAILQQLRGEVRYYLFGGHVFTPFLGGSAGLSAYGNEWQVSTFGPVAGATLGVEAQLARVAVVGVALNYKIIYFRPFTDSADIARPGSAIQLFGLDIQLEVRDPL